MTQAWPIASERQVTQAGPCTHSTGVAELLGGPSLELLGTPGEKSFPSTRESRFGRWRHVISLKLLDPAMPETTVPWTLR